MTTTQFNPANASGKMLSQFEAEINALDAEFVALTSGKQKPVKGKSIAVRAAEILAQIPILSAELDSLSNVRSLLKNFVTDCEHWQQATQEMKALTTLNTRLEQLKREMTERHRTLRKTREQVNNEAAKLRQAGIADHIIMSIKQSYREEE